ncbi:MAG: hypothetical protein J6Q27_03345, partial [Clostridia bacterium]|nr:hypothetical protein [Clostridia bacterium]
GEVIFKKYSPVGELSDVAGDYAETLAKTSGFPICITDMDSVIAVSGVPKRELSDKRSAPTLKSSWRRKPHLSVADRIIRRFRVLREAKNIMPALWHPLYQRAIPLARWCSFPTSKHQK